MRYPGPYQGRTGRSGNSGGCPKRKKFLGAWRQYVWSKISTVEVIVITVQTLYQWSKECAKVTLGQVWSNCARAEKYSQSAPGPYTVKSEVTFPNMFVVKEYYCPDSYEIFILMLTVELSWGRESKSFSHYITGVINNACIYLW